MDVTPMLPPIPKNQHYVWRYYLEAWAVDGVVSCYRQRDRRLFAANPAKIGSETYFYRVHDLADAELVYLELVMRRAIDGPMREIFEGFAEIFRMPSRLRRLVAAADLDDEDLGKARKLLDWADKAIGEQWQVAVEKKGSPLLASLRRRDAAFWRDEGAAADLCLFLATQYLRTARMRNAICRIDAPPGVDLAKVWPIESNFWATEIGLALFARHERLAAIVLTNDSAVPFIAGDQPFINLNPQSKPEVNFLYPVTPVTALLLSGAAEDQGTTTRAVSAIEAEAYNHAVYSWSDDQIYGIDGAYLKALAATPKLERQ